MPHFDGRHARFLIIATEQAMKATHRFKMGCLLVKSGRILGRGSNHAWHSNHAETTALGKNWKSEFADAICYIVRLRKNMPLGLARPCAKCWKALKDAGIKQVIYSTNDVEFPFRMETII